MHLCRAADSYIARLAGAFMATATIGFGAVASVIDILRAGIGGMGTMAVLAASMDVPVGSTADMPAAGAVTGKGLTQSSGQGISPIRCPLVV